MTIEERAYNYSIIILRDGENNTGKVIDAYSNDLKKNGYIQGATDQRKIDIEKACAWIKLHLPRVLDKYFPDNKDEYDTDVLNEDMREDFRNAMMEY